MSDKYLIFGATGSVGSSLAEQLKNSVITEDIAKTHPLKRLGEEKTLRHLLNF